MSKKIEWYQEVLSLEPGSRVFFPLAKLFVENGMPEDAVITLCRGLDRHPDYLEARMLLVELLTELGREMKFMTILNGLSIHCVITRLSGEVGQGACRRNSVILPFF